METPVTSCPLCGHARHGLKTHERLITLECRVCGGIVDIEFDPPDDPTLRGRITVIRPPHGRREIVLVDDDLGFLQTFGALLRHEGYAVVAEATWFSALQYPRHHVPDILITDVRIGGANGWELATYVKQRHSRLRCTTPAISRTTLPVSGILIAAVSRRERRGKQLNEEIWRLRRGDRVVICELQDDARAGRGWDVRLLEAGEVLFAKRCSREDDARFAAESFRQDYVRTGFTE